VAFEIDYLLLIIDYLYKFEEFCGLNKFLGDARDYICLFFRKKGLQREFWSI